MECVPGLVNGLSAFLLIVGALILLKQWRTGPVRYGRYAAPNFTWTVPVRWAWSLQEVPAFLVPVFLAYTTDGSAHGRRLLLCTFTLHYFHRSLVYPLRIRGGHPIRLAIVVCAAFFCFLNGFLQSHSLLHCSAKDLDQDLDQDWVYSLRTTAGLCLFVLGMSLNIHSDHILRNLRRPGEKVHKIPQGGLFELVSGANFLAEILEWFGFALAVWNLAAFSFSFFSLCSIGPRAIGHHRFYLEKFPDYPRNRKALIPFVL